MESSPTPATTSAPTAKNLSMIGSVWSIKFRSKIRASNVNRSEQPSDRYEIREEIGKGKFSVVYNCVNRATEEEFAMKAISKSKLTLKEKGLLQNEISLVKGLEHKNITRCYDIIETSTHVNIISERVYGGELYEFLKKKQAFTGIILDQ